MFRPLMRRLAAVALFAGVALAVLAPGIALADVPPPTTPNTPSYPYPYPSPSTPSTPECSTYPYPAPASCSASSTAQGSSLPFTGSDNSGLIAAIGGGIALAGIGLVVYARRQNATT